MLVGAQGWSGRADPSGPLLGRFDPTTRPLPCSLSPEKHMTEEDEDEAALIWVMRCSEHVKQSGVAVAAFEKAHCGLTLV